MGLGKIIGIIVGIPIFIIAVIPFILNSWVEGQIAESLLQAFGVSPIVVALIVIVGFLLLSFGVLKIAEAIF